MIITVTGAAGFIGFHACEALLQRGDSVFGVDNLNGYYDPALKEARLARLRRFKRFRFARIDISNAGEMLQAGGPKPHAVLHLAGQVGVRSSLQNPGAHIRDNLGGQYEVLEFCRQLEVPHLVHASTSAVYGANRALPSSATDRVDDPVSFYAATKRGGELLARSWASLHGLRVTSLRFFTVYGPWGRPDMATWVFTDSILRRRPIRLHGRGNMRRSFTFADDAVEGILGALDHAAPAQADGIPHSIYNIGNPDSVELRRFVSVIESAVGNRAQVEFVDAEPGEMDATEAEIGTATRDLGFAPRTPVEEGIPRFVDWFRARYE